MIKYFIGGVVIGVLIGIISVSTLRLYRPQVIHDTIQPKIDSIIRIENSYYKTINQTKIIYEARQDSINNIPDSFQFDLFRANCQRYSFLLSNDSASQD
jgi:beta-galactosidase GanA